MCGPKFKRTFCPHLQLHSVWGRDLWIVGRALYAIQREGSQQQEIQKNPLCLTLSEPLSKNMEACSVVFLRVRHLLIWNCIPLIEIVYHPELRQHTTLSCNNAFKQSQIYDPIKSKRPISISIWCYNKEFQSPN